ncbi:MAG: hypothetical protein V8T36_06155 [Ruthenibacterium lactatiformans]
MAIKRYAEYRMIGDKSTAALYRKSFAHYTEQSLLISAFFYAMCSLFLCGIFIIKYKIELLLVVPFLCGLFCFYLHFAFKKDSAVQKPEKLYREKGAAHVHDQTGRRIHSGAVHQDPGAGGLSRLQDHRLVMVRRHVRIRF